MPLEQTIALLHHAGAEWERSGARLVGFGLTSQPTPHRLQMNDHTLWTWWAVDALFFPVLIGAPAQIESPCAATGDPIRIQATPTGVQHVEPAGAVVSIVTPPINLAATAKRSAPRRTSTATPTPPQHGTPSIPRRCCFPWPKRPRCTARQPYVCGRSCRGARKL